MCVSYFVVETHSLKSHSVAGAIADVQEKTWAQISRSMSKPEIKSDLAKNVTVGYN